MNNSLFSARGWRRRSFVAAVAVGAAGAFDPVAALAEEPYPNHAIRLIVPYPPGGANDALGRAVAQKMTVSLKQPVVIDNRGGAGGVIGTQFVASQPKDGYTLLIINTLPHTASGNLYNKPPYDPVGDFAPISMVATTPYVLVVNSQSKFTTLESFIEYARANPGKLNYASGGNGGATHLMMELLKGAAKIDMTHVAYKGGGPAITDLLAGQVDATFENIVAVLPMINSGKLRPLAVSSGKSSVLLPQVLPVATKLNTSFDVSGRFAIVAPRGTPKPVIDTLHTAIAAAVMAPDIVESFRSQGIEAESSTPERLGALLQSEQKVWAKVIKDGGIQLD